MQGCHAGARSAHSASVEKEWLQHFCHVGQIRRAFSDAGKQQHAPPSFYLLAAKIRVRPQEAPLTLT